MKIAVLVSGGVDSSVSLKLLKDQGHDVTAFYLKIWLEDEFSFLGTCPWEEDLEYVRAVCAQMNVPLEVVSLQKEYWDRVVSYTIAEIKKGRTPNPDVLCNSQVKFDAFFDCIDASFEKVATGHYAMVKEEDGYFHLYSSPDAIKDQTYFLSHLNQKQLARAMFPIGNMPKSNVRDLAMQFDLANKLRKDSQGICFLGKLKFKDFIEAHFGVQPGDLIELETGALMGKHNGFWFYTIGQRQGLGLSAGPWYVVQKDIAHNIVYISKNYFSHDKARNRLRVDDIHWLGAQLEDLDNVHVKLRHGPKLYSCTIKALDNNTFDVTLAEHDQGIAAGQFAAFYKNGRCFAAGTIAQAL